MSDRIPLPEQIPPAKLLLRTRGECDLNPQHLLEVFGEQRRRFVAILQGFGPCDWAAPTRCAEWSAHDVVRHLCDVNTIAASLGPDDRTLMAASFDPRITPCGWLTASVGESPNVTLTRFVATTEKVLALWRTRLAQNRRFDVRLPYGTVDWTVFVLHGFWDSWLHERDVLLARGTDHPTDDDATAYATAYGVFIAAAHASMKGDQLKEKLTLGGCGVFDLDSRGGVTLTVTRITTAGPPAAQVTDALAGRAQSTAVLGDLPATSRAALSHLADFFNTPPNRSRPDAAPISELLGHPAHRGRCHRTTPPAASRIRSLPRPTCRVSAISCGVGLLLEPTCADSIRASGLRGGWVVNGLLADRARPRTHQPPMWARRPVERVFRNGCTRLSNTGARAAA